MGTRHRRPVIVSRNELELAIRSRRQVYLTYKDSTGVTQTATVLPLAVQTGGESDFLMFQRGQSRAAVPLEDIESFDFI